MNTKPVTRLFDENDQFTPRANVVHLEISAALSPLVEKYTNAGYSMRDVAYLIEAVASELTLDKILSRK